MSGKAKWQKYKQTVKQKLEAVMVRGRGYRLAELCEMAEGSSKSAVVSAIASYRRQGRLTTEKVRGRSGPRGVIYYSVYRLYNEQRLPAREVPPRREKHPLEKVPIEQVRRHWPVVGPHDRWRGKTWRDMPGNEEDMKRFNFFLWRRGRLRYDCHHARSMVDVMPLGRMAGLRAQGLA